MTFNSLDCHRRRFSNTVPTLSLRIRSFLTSFVNNLWSCKVSDTAIVVISPNHLNYYWHISFGVKFLLKLSIVLFSY